MTKKELIAIILGALISILVAVGTYFGIKLTQDDPTPPPVVVPVEVDPDVVGWRGETLYLRDFDSGVPIAARFNPQGYEVLTVQTLVPSFQGARLGDWEDPLQPIDYLSADTDIIRVQIPRDEASGDLSLAGVAISVEDQTLPERPAMPMYMELSSQQCLNAYFRATGDSNNWAMQGPITRKYIDLLRSFWIEPTKQAIAHYPSSLTQDVWGGTAYSYNGLVFEGAIAPPLMWAGDPRSAPPAAWVQGVHQLAPVDAVFYGIDEAGSGPSGASVQDATSRAGYLTSLAPGRMVVQTGLWHSEYGSHPEILFWPVRNVAEAAPRVDGTYGSCMGTGNCQNVATPAPRKPFPVHVLEGDPIEDWQRSILDAHDLGASAYMHFSSNLRLTTAWEPGGLRNEGGNGDGTQLYFNPENGDPWPSLRLMNYHIALQAVTKESMR